MFRRQASASRGRAHFCRWARNTRVQFFGFYRLPPQFTLFRNRFDDQRLESSLFLLLPLTVSVSFIRGIGDAVPDISLASANGYPTLPPGVPLSVLHRTTLASHLSTGAFTPIQQYHSRVFSIPCYNSQQPNVVAHIFATRCATPKSITPTFAAIAHIFTTTSPSAQNGFIIALINRVYHVHTPYENFS